ncbi:hypothetical protein O6H91_01G066400 [Diphasiastrum complanatum]|uniref:Uncharacterized protein n=1 Tax=Diphasiastrum complanatum TaxID=34168 RepID=A0ACC2ERW2_DIPCM|nr:hypothetical protein O6H91_01G066400 [Diphasiastrum complanatum]
MISLHGGRKADDWLPVSGSRNTKWWYAAFHNVTTMVGAGVLSLPAAMVYLGCRTSMKSILVITTGRSRYICTKLCINN